MFLVLLLGTAFSSIHGQNSKFTGSWEGVLQAGIEIRIVFHIEENGKVKADSPDQSIPVFVLVPLSLFPKERDPSLPLC